MKIAEKSIIDRLPSKDTFLNWLDEFGIYIFFIMIIAITGYFDHNTKQQKDQQKIQQEKKIEMKLKNKIGKISKTKPNIQCFESDGKILKPKDYNLIKIGDDVFIETKHTNYNIDKCEIYESLTPYEDVNKNGEISKFNNKKLEALLNQKKLLTNSLEMLLDENKKLKVKNKELLVIINEDKKNDKPIVTQSVNLSYMSKDEIELRKFYFLFEILQDKNFKNHLIQTGEIIDFPTNFQLLKYTVNDDALDNFKTVGKHNYMKILNKTINHISKLFHIPEDVLMDEIILKVLND